MTFLKWFSWLGRAGTIAGDLLVQLGVDAEEAVELVRAARPAKRHRSRSRPSVVRVALKQANSGMPAEPTLADLPWGFAAGGRAIEPTEQAYLDWNARVEKQMKTMIWSHPKARSYYLNSKGRNYVSCPFKLADYWNWTRNPGREALKIT